MASFIQKRLPAAYRARAAGEGEEPEIEGFFVWCTDRVNDDPTVQVAAKEWADAPAEHGRVAPHRRRSMAAAG